MTKETIPVSVYLGEHLAAIVEFADDFDLVGFVFSLRGSKATLQGTGGSEGFQRDLTLTVDGDLPAVLKAAAKVVRLFELPHFGIPQYREKREWGPELLAELRELERLYAKPGEMEEPFSKQVSRFVLSYTLGRVTSAEGGCKLLPCEIQCPNGLIIETNIPYDELSGVLVLFQPKETTDEPTN